MEKENKEIEVVNADKVLAEEGERITIAGVTYNARYTMYSIMRMQKEHGVNVIQSKFGQGEPDPHLLTVMLWGALISDKKDLDFNSFADCLSLGDLMKYDAVVAKVFKTCTETNEKKNRKERRSLKKQ